MLSVAILLAIGSLGQAPEEAASPPLSVGAETEAVSRYVWRGLAWTEGPAIQPSAWVSAFDTTLTAWGNVVAGEEANQGQLNEVDLTLQHSREWAGLAFDFSIGTLLYPNQRRQESPRTGEAAVTTSLPVGPVELFTSHTVDLAQYAGAWFGTFGATWASEQLAGDLGLEATATVGAASAGFNEAYVGPSITAVEVASLDLAATWRPLSFGYLRLRTSGSSLLAKDLRGAVSDPDILMVALAVGVEYGGAD